MCLLIEQVQWLLAWLLTVLLCKRWYVVGCLVFSTWYIAFGWCNLPSHLFWSTEWGDKASGEISTLVLHLAFNHPAEDWTSAKYIFLRVSAAVHGSWMFECIHYYFFQCGWHACSLVLCVVLYIHIEAISVLACVCVSLFIVVIVVVHWFVLVCTMSA